MCLLNLLFLVLSGWASATSASCWGPGHDLAGDDAQTTPLPSCGSPMDVEFAKSEMTSHLQLPTVDSLLVADNQDVQDLHLLAGAGSQRICKDGRLYPNVFVLGAQKGATTTLDFALLDAGIESSANWMVEKPFYGDGAKESEIVAVNLAHFVNESMKDPSTLKRFARQWHDLFRMCLQVPHLKQLAELTVRNLEMTDPHFVKDWPKISVAQEKLWPSQFALLGFDFPPALRYSYGEAWGKVRFVVSLREPIARQNSALYQWLYHHHDETKDGPFDPGAIMRTYLEQLVTEHEFSYGLWHSLYGRHLFEWFHYWKESQFLVFPYKYMTSKSQSVCKSISQHLQATLNCSKFWERENSEHMVLSVAEQVPKVLQEKAAQALEGELQLLIDVLTKAHSKGLVMPVFGVPKGRVATSRSVRRWLVNGW